MCLYSQSVPVYAIGMESKDSIWVCAILTKKKKVVDFRMLGRVFGWVEIFAEFGGEWVMRDRPFGYTDWNEIVWRETEDVPAVMFEDFLERIGFWWEWLFGCNCFGLLIFGGGWRWLIGVDCFLMGCFSTACFFGFKKINLTAHYRNKVWYDEQRETHMMMSWREDQEGPMAQTSAKRKSGKIVMRTWIVVDSLYETKKNGWWNISWCDSQMAPNEMVPIFASRGPGAQVEAAVVSAACMLKSL